LSLLHFIPTEQRFPCFYKDVYVLYMYTLMWCDVMFYRIVSLRVRVTMLASSCAVNLVLWNMRCGWNQQWLTLSALLAGIAHEKSS